MFVSQGPKKLHLQALLNELAPRKPSSLPLRRPVQNTAASHSSAVEGSGSHWSGRCGCCGQSDSRRQPLSTAIDARMGPTPRTRQSSSQPVANHWHSRQTRCSSDVKPPGQRQLSKSSYFKTAHTRRRFSGTGPAGWAIRCYHNESTLGQQLPIADGAVHESEAPRGTMPVTKFDPRLHFPEQKDLPRSYFLGHHAAGLDRMRNMLRYVDLVIECRDARIPFTGVNPLLERTLLEQGARRLICYTKEDLVASDRNGLRQIEQTISDYHAQTNAAIRSGLESILFVSHKSPGESRQEREENARQEKKQRKKVLNCVIDVAKARWSLTGLRVLVVGMPNVGKSTLLNVLRASGVQKSKVARTGADPGVTRKVGAWVKVIDGKDVDAALAAESARPERHSEAGATSAVKSQSQGVYVADTPGVFMPYVPSSDAMLKLALTGAVKDESSIIHPVTLADYLLFHMNLPRNMEARDIYVRKYLPDSGPTNDVITLLDAVARRIGRLTKGKKPDLEGTAVWLVKKWRQGFLGKMPLDEVDDVSIKLKVEALEQQGEAKGPVSITQARKLQKEARREKSKQRYLARMSTA